jgi:hypothetical protein
MPIGIVDVLAIPAFVLTSVLTPVRGIRGQPRQPSERQQQPGRRRHDREPGNPDPVHHRRGDPSDQAAIISAAGSDAPTDGSAAQAATAAVSSVSGPARAAARAVSRCRHTDTDLDAFLRTGALRSRNSLGVASREGLDPGGQLGPLGDLRPPAVTASPILPAAQNRQQQSALRPPCTSTSRRPMLASRRRRATAASRYSGSASIASTSAASSAAATGLCARLAIQTNLTREWVPAPTGRKLFMSLLPNRERF